LELGVDIGGIDVTLHCGYPSSHSSLLQQAGRAGRGISRLDMPSFSIMICFNSPFEQQIWRHPKNLLSCGLSVPTVVPLNVGLTEGHMLCAGKEYPLTGQMPVTNLLSGSLDESHHHLVMSDYDLLGSELVYCEALATLVSVGSLVKETVPLTHAECKQMTVYTTHSVSQCRIPCLLN
jgi:DEAD/DEAH box helicase domain-containing protein